MDNRSISELELATSVKDEDILLISQKENNQYISRKIGAGVFRGASAYELAVNNGFNGTLNDWLSSIKGWQPITSGEFVDLLNKELDKSTLYLDLKTTINTSTSELRQEINKQLNDISNLKDQVVAEADKRIKEIHDLNSGLIEEANKRIQDIQVIQQSITLESDERLRQASALADKLLEEKEIRTQEIKNLATKLEDEQNDRVLEIENIIDDLSSEVAVRQEMIRDAVNKITKEAEERVKALDAIQKSITKDQQERLVEIENILESIDTLDTQVGTNHSYVLNNYSTTKQANELTATQIEALKTTYIDPQLEQKASTTALQQITTEVGKLDEGLRANIKKVDGVFAQVNPNMAGSSSGSVGQDSSFVGVWTEQSARIEEDFALGQRINNVVATYTSNKGVTDARIAQEEKVRADADSALASIVTSLTSKVGDSEGKILTLQEVNTEQNKSISQISSKLDNTVQALDTKASSSALTDLTSNVEVLEDKVESSTSSITLLKNSLNVVEDGLSKKADGSALSELASKVSVIDGTLTSTNSSVTSLTSSVGTKNRTYYQTTTPTEALVSGDLWVNSSAGKNNEIKRYDGTSWVTITDPRTATNSSAISSLQTTTTQNQDSITTQGRLITDLQSELDLSKNNLLLKADASALNDLSSKVTSVDGKVTSVSQDLLELHNNLTSIEEGLELKAEASALRDLTSKVEDTGDLVRSQSQDIVSLSNSLVSIESEVDTKGKVIYSDKEPSQEDRINNNLWIDTSGGQNTPKMWNGVSWVAVSDKVATDALNQAELNKTALATKADSSAVASLTNKVEAVEKNITSQSTDLVVLKNSLEEVSTVSNDKGKVIFSSTQPKDVDRIVQNLWIDTSDNKNTPKRWTGTEWVPVTDKVALDALAASNETLTKLNTKADASAVSSLDSKVTKINETLTSQSTDITTLNNSLVVANDKLSTKGKIIYSDSAPVEGDRLPQNLWIDTKGGGNIPKRWNGEFWLVVTDKTAIDALAAANQAKQALATKVDSSAFNSLSSKVKSAEQNISSQSDSITKLNNSLEATDEVAKEALAGVSGLTQQITTKASTEALENLSSSVTSINGQVQANTQKVIELSSDIETIEGSLSTKVDASVLVDYSTKMSTEEAISKASTSLTSSYTKAVNDSKADTDLKLDDQLLINKVSSSGKLLFTDVTFLKGTNSVAVYDNKNTGKVRVDRIVKESDNPTKSTHQLKITIAEGANPNYGGFYQAITSRANATFVIKYLMKVPVNYKLAVAGNALGTGSSDKIIGTNVGTGGYETYIRIIRCGSTGTFSTGGHLSFRGTDLTTGSTDTIMLASIETWDATDFIRAATSDEVASINASLINDYYTIAAADKAISNSLTAFKTSYVDQELNKKASANTVEQITNEINNTETGLKATANKLSGVFAQVNPEFVGTDKGYIGKDSGSVSVWSEYSARIEGDLATSSRIDSVAANWENNLSLVQTKTNAISDKVSSLASQVTVLNSTIDNNMSFITNQYLTKAKADEVIAQNITELKTNYISPELNLKASSSALEQTQSQVTEVDGRLKTTSQKTEGVYAQVNPTLAGSTTGSIGSSTKNVGSWSQYSALIEGDFATSQKIDSVSARVDNNTANIIQTNTVVIDKFNSVAESLNKVETNFNNNLSSVTSTIGAWTDPTKSISKYITDLNATVGDNKAQITNNYLTTVDTKKAIAGDITKLKTEYISPELNKKATSEALDQVKSAIENTDNGLVATATKLQGVFVKVNPQLIGSTKELIGKNSSSVGVWTEQSARIEEDFALGQRIDNLYVNLGENAAAIQTVNKVLVDKTQSLANSITSLDSKYETSVGSINTKLGTWSSSESSISDYVMNINTAVGKNSSSIKIQGTSIDGLSSQYTVKLDTNGRVSGFGLASNPTNQASSEFAVVADKFYVASPQESGKGKSPFYILPTKQVIDGVTVPAGTYIDQSFIRKASIDTAHIRDAAIVDAKIFNLDASKITTGFISADRIEAGTIQSKHIGVNAIEPTNFSYSVYKQFNETFVSIEDAYADGKLTPIEKRSIKEQVEFIDMEFETVKDSMATFKVPHTRVKYDALKTYLETLDLNSETITAIDRMVYEKSFADYYAELRSNQNNLFKEIENLNGASIKAAKTANDLLTAWKTYGQDTLYIDDTRIAVKMIGAEQIATDSITADKIKFGSVTSKTLSGDVRTDISKGTSAYKTVADLAANLNDDNIITPVEKTFLFDKWQEIQKVSSWINWQCTNIFKNSQDKETIYDPFYTAVRDFIAERVSKDGLNVANNIIDFAISWEGKVIVGSEAMRQVLLNYYEAENKMLGKLQQTQYKFTFDVNNKVTTASGVLDNIANDNIITKQEKPALKLQYTNIINDYDDLMLAASNQGLSSAAFTTAYNQLVKAFTTIFQDMTVDTNWSGEDLRAKMKAYADQRGTLIQVLANDAKAKANEASARSLEALQALSKMADDNVITIYEKPALSVSWQNIISDSDDLETAGKNQQIDTTAFKTAYTNLKTAVDLILANPAVNTEWSGQDLRDRMKAYADQRGILLQKLANDAKDKANAAMAAITSAVSDSVLTPSEKQQFKIKWVEEYQDFDKLKLKVQSAGVSTSSTNYTDYLSSFNYINDNFTTIWNSANNSTVDPVNWKTRFENLRKYKTLLENEISAKIKDIASSALAATRQLTQTVGTKADSSALLTLDHDVEVIDGQVQAHSESIQQLTNNLDAIGKAKADASAVTALTSRVTEAEGNITSQSKNTIALENSLSATDAIAKNAVPSVKSFGNSKSFPFVYFCDINSASVAGNIIIETPITFTAKMFTITATGYNYLKDQSSIDFAVSGYAYSGTSILEHSASNYGRLATRIRLGVKNSKVCIILTSLAPGNTWRYPKFSLSATIGYTLPPDTWKDGWTYSIVAEDNLATAGITAIIEPTIVDVNKELNANASALSTLTSDVSLIDGRVTATSKDVSNLSTAIGDNKASISTLASSVDGIKSEYSVKMNVNGKVSGFGLISGPKSSDFSILSDTFKVSNGTTDVAPFSVINNEVIFNGKVSFRNVTDKGWKITVIGTSAALPTAEQYSGTYIDNGNYTQDFRTSGIRVVIYDVNKNVQLDNLYDTSTAAGCTALKNAVINLNLDTQIVTIRSVGFSLANNQDLISAVNKLGFDGSSLNTALTYNTKTSFCGISQFIAAKNSINNIMFINADIIGKQQRAIASATIKDGVLIPDSIPMDSGAHKLNEAADIAIDTLTPSIGAAQSTANSKSKTFTAQPVPPYTTGDLWKDGTTIKVCTVARSSGSYIAADWILAGDVTSSNTSADTAKVGGIASATVVNNAAKGIEVYNDVMSDLRITPVEKTSLNTEWTRIKAEYTNMLTHAASIGVSTTSFTSAYNALNSTSPTMTSILGSMITTTSLTAVQRDALRTQFTNYYAQVTALNKAISDKVADNAKAYTDAIEVGAANLLYRSYDSSLWITYGSPTFSLTSDNYVMQDSVLVTQTTFEGSGGTNTLKVYRQGNNLEVGKTLTMSAYVKNRGTKNLTVNTLGLNPSSSLTVAPGKIERIVFTGTLTSSAQFRIETAAVADAFAVDIIHLKFEYGNKATSWTPSPAEVNALIDSKAKTFLATPTVPYSAGDIWKDGATTKVALVFRGTGSFTASDWVLVGDVTANNTAADTAKVNGISAATVSSNANKGATVYDDVMSDLKITPVEKTAISQEWNRIQAEYAKYLEQATSLGLATSAYSSAYTALATTSPSMSSILSSMTTTTTLTAAQRDTYRSQYTAYYTQTANIVKDINNKIAANADTNAKTIVSNIRLGGTNLFPKTLIKRGYWISSGTLSTLNSTDHVTYDQFLPTGSNNNLIYQVWNDSAVSSSNSNRVCFYDSTKTYISQVTMPLLSASTPYQVLKIAIPSTAAFVKLGAIAGTSSFDNNIRIKFEFGDNPTDWSIAPEDIQNKLEAFVTNNTGNLLNNTVFSGTTDKWSAGTVTNQAFFNTTVPVHTITSAGNTISVSDKFTVDPSKAYEVSAWFKADSTVGSLYLGLYAFNKDGTNIGLNEISRTTGADTSTANTNFYFQYTSGAGLPLDWVKWVGYIMPAGTTSTDMKGIGSTASNARMLPNTAQMQVRWLNYYNDGTSTTKWAANFKCVEVDPNSIIAGVGAKYIAGSKAQVYTTTPTTPYSVGDIWKNGTTVYVCTVGKNAGGTYSVSDWIKSGDVTAENTSKDVVSVNGVAAATVVNNAQIGATLSANIMSDLIITPVEKSSLLTEWNRIKAEYTNLYNQAIALNISTADFSAAYTALDGTTPRISSEVLASMVTNYTLTTDTRDALRAKLNTYFSKATDMSVNITTKINVSAATAKNTADSKAKVFTSTPTVPYTIGDVWRNGNSLYVTTVDRLTGAYTAADWTKASDVTSENTSANTSSVGSVSATDVATLVSDISNDSKLTPAEKRALNAEWERIKNTYPALITQAVNLGVIYTRTAYDALAAYIPSLTLTSQTTIGIVATTFRTNFSNYYEEEATILKNIQDKQRTNVIAAIATAAADATTKANAVRDDIPELIFAQGGYADANALITINGVNQTYTAAVGVLVMVINQTTGVVETKTIYTADPTGFSTMKTAITAVAAGKIVVMVSRQNIPMTTDTNFRDALRLIASTDVIYNQYTRKTNNTFAIIGTKGGIEGSANEAVVSVDGNMNLDNATTSGTLIAGKLSPNSTTSIDGGLILTDSINANSIKAGSITAAQIAGGTITGDKIEAGSITADRIQIGSLGRDRLDTGLGNIVDTAYSIANSANNKVNNLSVGGRNLLKDSALIQFKGSDNGNGGASIVVDDFVRLTPVNAGNIYGNTATASELLPGEQYTFSVMVKTAMTSIGLYCYSGGNHIKSSIPLKSGNVWERVSFTFTQTTARAKNFTFLGGFHQLQAGVVVEYRNFKLEKGNLATDWIPAPEDVQNNINTVSSVASGARDLLNRWKANGNGTLYIDDNSIAVNMIGANQIAAGAINANHIYGGSITGDKIKAGTSITAPTINGGNINIGNGNFVVDQWGNLNANSGTFRGTVLAENISGKIDVESLKSSAWMGGYTAKFYSSINGGVTPVTNTALIPSKGSIIQHYGDFMAVNQIIYTINLIVLNGVYIDYSIMRVDDEIEIVVYQDNAKYSYVKHLSYFNRDYRLYLPSGKIKIEYRLLNSKGGDCGIVLLGDYIDNTNIKYA